LCSVRGAGHIGKLNKRGGDKVFNIRNNFEKKNTLVMLNTAQLTSVHLLETLLKPSEVDKKKL
jgi:hypothetical protein